MDKEEAKKVLDDEIRPLYEHLKDAGDNPTILVASMGLLTGLHHLMENLAVTVHGDREHFEKAMASLLEQDGNIIVKWSGSEEHCTWALV